MSTKRIAMRRRKVLSIGEKVNAGFELAPDLGTARNQLIPGSLKIDYSVLRIIK